MSGVIESLDRGIRFEQDTTDSKGHRGRPAADKPYKLTDSMTPGLFLLVHPNGSKYWRFRYWIDKKERLQAIGVYPLISLKEARKRATESRLLIAQGVDPMDLARKEKAIDALNAIASFKAVAEDWMATKVSGWSESYTKQVRSALEKDVYPVLGKRSIVNITARDVLALLQKKERTAPEQARKLRQRIGEIFKFAVITELVNRNPVADLDTALKARRPGHNAWIPINEIPAFYKALERAGSVQIQTAILFFEDGRIAPDALGMGRSAIGNNHIAR